MKTKKLEKQQLLTKTNPHPSELLIDSSGNENFLIQNQDFHSPPSSDNENEDDSDRESNNNGFQIKTSLCSYIYKARKCLCNTQQLLRAKKLNRIHRNAKRMIRLLMCITLMPVILIMLYFPLYSSIQDRQFSLSGWGQNISRNISLYILPENDTNILEPRNLCQTHDKFFLLIVVCSRLQNFSIRQTIRETWGNTTEFNYGMFLQMHAHLKGQYLEISEQRLSYYSEYLGLNKNQTINNGTIISMRVVFFIGRSKSSNIDNDELSDIRLRNESERYQDIIQEDFIDTYNNLTIKSVLILKWVTRRCIENCAFVMKCDDDTFVNVPNLLHYLLGGTVPIYNDTVDMHNARTYKVLAQNNRLNKTRNYLAGYVFCTARPVSNLNSKWYMPYYMYPNDKYPKYLSGSGYIMSVDVVPKLYEAAFNTPLIYLEDIYVTGICADIIKLPRLHQPLFGYLRKKALCSLKGSITQHEMKGDKLTEAFTFVTNLTNQCASPGYIFKNMPLRKSIECG